ncbi:chitobiase/beta-hexosaminidase C-terminal domain-containing protein [Sulfurimonas sp. SAG-AH-194-C21]|nr:CAP domain-containing protein [Sulfurimonas sp. SAG-AH-194-C21]MDF1883567.1 chitobiase/beta-hexosaminidase C-terminal domain-containing protein [Sulfurimonas sp. SAG-AH-194-C21]
MKHINIKVLLSLALFSLIKLNLVADSFNNNEALTYLNTLRNSAGLPSFTRNISLENASINHSNYLNEDGSISHYEPNTANSFYTGNTPNDRGIAAGYQALYYSENISSGQAGVRASLDDLMSAIYHRFGFLDLNIDEIGIGVNVNSIFTYNMGNSLLNALCNSSSYSGTGSYYYNVCADSSLKIEVSNYDNNLYALADAAQDYTLWPPSGSIDIPPVFFEEIPDPLPNRSVSGYPISIEFNDRKYEGSNIDINSFKIYDESNTEVTNTLLMDSLNDPNGHHTALQFTLFPLDRLKWNHTYTIELSYTIDGISTSKTWLFTTRNLNYDIFEITSNTETIRVTSGDTYAFYFPPVDGSDIFNSVSYSYSTASSPTVDIYDGNTLIITMNGLDSQKAIFNLTNGKTLTLQIGSLANNAFFGTDITANSEIATNGDNGSISVKTSLSVTGSAITHYKVKIDSNTYSSQNSVSTLIDLTLLSEGLHSIYIVGYNGLEWQSEATATKLSFTVDNTAPNSVLFSMPDGSSIEDNTSISMSSNSQNIYYTTDSSLPTTNSTRSSSFSITSKNNGSVTIKAIAVDSAGNKSTVSQATYIVNISKVILVSDSEKPQTLQEDPEKPQILQEDPEKPTIQDSTPVNNEIVEENTGIFYIGLDTIFTTNIEGISPLYTGETALLSTPIFRTFLENNIFVELFSNAKGVVEVRLNINAQEFKLPEFRSGSIVDVQYINGKVKVTIKTKLNKTITFNRR